jgi:hypothetical protein
MAGRQGFAPAGNDRLKMQKLPDSVDDLPERVLVDLDAEDKNAYTIVDDTPEEDRGRPTRVEKSILDQEDDLRGLSKNVQKRIDRLRFETETERRGREAAERERDAAIALARTREEENRQFRERERTGVSALAASMKDAADARLEDAKRRLAAAHADGDSAAIAQATADISTATSQLTRIVERTPKPEDAAAERRVEPQRTEQPASNVAPNVERWISRNRDWWQKDAAKTAKAMSIHYDLVARGVQPSSTEYTRELDKGMKAVYSDHEYLDFPSDDDGERRRESAPAPRRTNVVAEGSRETRTNPSRNVELTNSEVALAQRMRIPLAVYAAEKAKKLRAEGNGAE